jgi:5-methylcytosine-specific restriction endonuclease McrA
MIPLAEGGINDVTNLQLLCGECNLKKGDRCTGTSCRYERWFGRDE